MKMNETINKTTAKSAGAAQADAMQKMRETVETGSAQIKQTSEKMTAASIETTSALKNSFSTALLGTQDYNMKVVEFAQINSQAALEFMQQLPSVKSPSDFVSLTTDFSRRQLETLTEQAKELTALAQKVTLATTEPLKTGVAKAFSQAA
jgi:phasin